MHLAPGSEGPRGGGPEGAAEHARRDGPGHEERTASFRERPEEAGGEDGAEDDLALDPNVPEPGSEGEEKGARGEDERDPDGECLPDLCRRAEAALEEEAQGPERWGVSEEEHCRGKEEGKEEGGDDPCEGSGGRDHRLHPPFPAGHEAAHRLDACCVSGEVRYQSPVVEDEQPMAVGEDLVKVRGGE
jgi:hypothetical protein